MGSGMDADRKWSRILPHPFLPLFAVATVAVLLAANPDEGVQLRDLADPLIMASCVVLFSWGACGLFLSGRLPRSIAATVTSMLLLLSGYLFGWLRSMGAPLPVRAGMELALVVLLIGTALVVTAKVRWGTNATRFLNLFAGFTVILTLPAVSRTVIDARPASAGVTLLPDTTGLYRPDIYLIILDAYTGNESLAEHYEFDNSPFMDSLTVRDFAVPERARSNYVKTFLSIGSMLNRAYYDELTPPAQVGNDRRPYNYRMEFNRTAFDLQRLGYEFLYVGSSYPPLASNRLAHDQYIDHPSREFEALWYRTTIIWPVMALCETSGKCRGRDLPFDPESAAETEGRIQALVELVERPGRKFVYAHWLLPHGPYRFDSTCNPQRSRWTIGQDVIESDSLARHLYINQLQCTNRKLLEVIDEIQSGTPESIIILQADHGHGRFPGEIPTRLEDADPGQVSERFDIFAAYSGPGFVADSLAAQRTPVNVLRTLFRVLWGVDEPPLTDRYFWSDPDHPLALRALDID